MDKVIDIQNWTRKEEYLFFRTFLNPMISVTVASVTNNVLSKSKEKHISMLLQTVNIHLLSKHHIPLFK